MGSREKSKLSLSSIPIPNTLSRRRTSQASIQNSPLHSRSKSNKTIEEDFSHVDPDDLFIRFTIPEVRTIQARLRADADAKQEELRQMVGERYRDLLQASTSIMAMAESSRHVMDAFAGIRETMLLEQREIQPRSSLTRGKDDHRLKALQSLSAHVKLLLDTPEHLWRLLENKEYLPAAWLFLLSRVVHRTLVTDDPEETASWEKEGISVLTQFPLVQRQWDSIAQLRPQITHRATQYLRQVTTSQEACSTILTLHLLDSLPLTDIISTFLSQRSKALNVLTTRNLDGLAPTVPKSPGIKAKRKSRQLLATSEPSKAVTHKNRKEALRHIKDALLEVLQMIWGSIRIARDVFGPQKDGSASLVEQTLTNIHSDAPSESVLTTSSLLATLPSSTHLLTLPPSIVSYKPYIDPTSSTVHIETSILDSKLSSWFEKAIHGLDGRVQVWLSGLDSIRELWTLRRKLLDKLQNSQGLQTSEKAIVQGTLDNGVRDRVIQVVNASLAALEEHLESHLHKALLGLQSSGKDRVLG
ncbi:hypothetical protein M422DRAFT_271943 [Sphaerobolus stellatus SS14]|uniref:Conserved oligomeric Golgi complex subunit 1 n=1 Tax=Sphaerobolus stellatus (strain SS14) TaxID=990650 RepID=A0A0C9UN83_SPHS4|nr:hypothetical protein M422DRAFT_271943 [Sphaerobolus stellatus SS14]